MTENEAKACAMLARAMGILGVVRCSIPDHDPTHDDAYKRFPLGSPEMAGAHLENCQSILKEAIEQLGKPGKIGTYVGIGDGHTPIQPSPIVYGPGPDGGNQWGGQQP